HSFAAGNGIGLNELLSTRERLYDIGGRNYLRGLFTANEVEQLTNAGLLTPVSGGGLFDHIPTDKGVTFFSSVIHSQ
ncbi:hypothetical protein OFC24_33100, partial [Escherichia coli]|nr:hypothetical protein [Escherichia coli]